MKVKPVQLQNGCILTKDVYGLSDSPIIKRNTVLTNNLIEMLHFFLVDFVEVETVLANGEKFIPIGMKSKRDRKDDNDLAIEHIPKDYHYQYLEAVKQFKKLFQNWQAGQLVEMVKVRKIFIHLFEQIINEPKHLLHLHHYTNKEDYLFHHSVYVGILSVYLGHKLQFSKGDWLQIGFSGVLADIGIAKVSPAILQKPGPLTSIEFEEVKKHPIHSYKMLKHVTGISDSVLLSVLQHHERLNGSGYPLGTDANKLHIFSQIVAVADVYHAMTSERYYRAKKSPYQVLEAISKEQFGKFDLKVVQALLESFTQVSVGEIVRLNSGDIAEIVYCDQKNPTRSLVKLLSDQSIVQLENQNSLYIEELLKK
ncbi:HD-GYP domain-containing protein [Halalkalibacter kiskunsagensis]|uniref:HD-GYP domain-containing protein n=1 Tax=Halalkalibacter kiskunsagensis TaxID=1548599 RepID=UPI00300915C3